MNPTVEKVTIGIQGGRCITTGDNMPGIRGQIVDHINVDYKNLMVALHGTSGEIGVAFCGYPFQVTYADK